MSPALLDRASRQALDKLRWQDADVAMSAAAFVRGADGPGRDRLFAGLADDVRRWRLSQDRFERLVSAAHRARARKDVRP